MASVTSLGIHKPCALPSLIAEGILPVEPAKSLYEWHTITNESVGHEDEPEEEELLLTEYTVTWSRGGVIQRVFRFHTEREAVTKALFTHFLIKSEDVSRSKSSKIKRSSSLNIPQGLEVHAGRQDAASEQQDSEANYQSQYRLAVGDISGSGSKAHRRALVVILKTQAHVFFISGTSHIVHLPFEVDAAFALPYGLLLQRRMSQSIPQTLDLPAVPSNSVALSQSTSGLIPSSQDQSSLMDVMIGSDPKDPSMPLLSSALEQTNNVNRDAVLPRVYYLNDPLSEIGSVVMGQNLSYGKASLLHHRSAEWQIETVDPQESLLYVSATDELAPMDGRNNAAQPLLLAITQNQERKDRTIWSVEYVNLESMTQSERRVPSGSSETISRRRSSYGPGASTGANTPISRNITTGRDSLGGGKTRIASSRDVLSDNSLNDNDRGLVAHLDSALEDSSTSLRNSRRVSSLLARADLTNSKDQASFSDLMSGYPTGNSARRGASFGSQSARLNFELKNRLGLSHTGHSFGLRCSTENPPVVQPSVDEMVEDSDDDDCMGFSSSNLRYSHRGLQKEIILRKIHTVRKSHGGKETKSTEKDPSTGFKVLVLRAPSYNIANKDQASHCFVCMLDRDVGKLTMMDFAVRKGNAATSHHDRAREELSSKGATQPYQINLMNFREQPDVVDVCKIRQDGCFRLLILKEDEKGQSTLSLQAPWTSSFRLQIPQSLKVYNPYRITNGIHLKQQREGGFKRVLSQSPRKLVYIAHEAQTRTASVEDSEGVMHRLEVQLQPNNPLVHKMILLCDCVFPNQENSGDLILSLWWSAMSWMQFRSEDETDTEWTAFVIALFSIVVNFLNDRRSETAPRQKRKGGLLRSSSGANTNIESWEAMLTEERSLSGVSPAWMEGEAWQWTLEQEDPSVQAPDVFSRRTGSSRSAPAALPALKKSPYLFHCITLAREFRLFLRGSQIAQDDIFSTSASIEKIRMSLATILIGLHLLREEMKLESLASDALHGITPILAQLGGWLGWPSWSFRHGAYYMLESTNMASWLFDESVLHASRVPAEPFTPPSILNFIETTNLGTNTRPFVTLLDLVAGLESTKTLMTVNGTFARLLIRLTPRTILITNLLAGTSIKTVLGRVSEMSSWGLDKSMLETLPESVAVSFRAAISSCQTHPPPALDKDLLKLIGRDDLESLEEEDRNIRSQGKLAIATPSDAMRDIHNVCNSTLEVETVGAYDGAAEVDRQSITRMIFKEDQRFAEAAKLLHPLHAPVAQCIPEPGWSDTELLEAQQELAKTIALRTLAVSPGRSCLFYNACLPLLTERFPIHGFTLSCIMKPSNTTITADKLAYTEEKVSWAFFHAGVEAGLSIARNAKGIDSSWILFNKPQELKNRHAGFLLALGLNGHLKSIAKWVAFKYLTPKHTMTSIGLLLGLAASHLGTMDTLITRLLSVHVTRMLPPGAAELNLSPLTQTGGVMAIGLLYCNTQHRRMSEIMLSEMENVEEEDPSNPQDSLRDEGYRLAAGYALGFINLGRGKDLKGLHDMQIVERLLALAVGTKKVSLVHILDKGTAAAAVALALIFMKTQDAVLARKIDVPDTMHQFDYVRPDVFLLRTVARHLIMWDNICPTFSWIKNQLPSVYQYKFKLTIIRSLKSEDMPFFNIIAGLCLSIGLRFAGSGSIEVRTLLCYYLGHFMRICRLPVLNYDSKLARTTVRNCQDVVALAAACVMAGFGDLLLLRRLRSLHGRTEMDVPYGSHLAVHLATGILFLGGGTHTFSTSNIAIASLLCAFYPLFPTIVLDNKSHLQAFRHLWVLAAEPRCLMIYEVDTQRLIALAVAVTLKDGSESIMTAPCLLPELEGIASIRTRDSDYWEVVLDLAGNPAHLQALRRHQSIFVRRRAAYDAHTSVFSATMQALNDAQSTHRLGRQAFEWVFSLPTFGNFDRAERALVLPPESAITVYKATRGTVVDDRLMLETAWMDSRRTERLWNLRVLFAWADKVSRDSEQWGWLGKEVVEALKVRLLIQKKIQSP